MKKTTAYYHLPGLFEFYELYEAFLPVYRKHREYFYDWCEIGSIYGAPADCIWGGGRIGSGERNVREIMKLMNECGISARLTFSNSMLRKEHLSDEKCNELCRALDDSENVNKGMNECMNEGVGNGASGGVSNRANNGKSRGVSDRAGKGASGVVSDRVSSEVSNRVSNGVIVHSDLLAEYIKKHYPKLYLVSSTTKVLTDFDDFADEVKREDFRYVVPDFRLNKAFEKMDKLADEEKDKVEFLCNECCWFGCYDRRNCYEVVSRQNLGEDCPDHVCVAPDLQSGYRFSKAMENPAFISVSDIRDTYMPMGFSNFKIEGRGLGSALVLEFLLYYMVKPEYQLHVREEIYLDNMLDLF